MPTKRRVDRSRLGFWTGSTMDPRVTLRRQVPPWESALSSPHSARLETSTRSSRLQRRCGNAGVEPVLAGAGLYREKAEAEGIAFCEVRPSDAGL
jgi:hypothetical protein